MALGPIGALVLAKVARSSRSIARDRIAALPFAVIHDRPVDPWGWRQRLVDVTITLRRALDDDVIARRIEREVPWCTVRVDGATIVLAPCSRRGAHLVLLADTLATWGVRLHETVGIVSAKIAWAPGSGPPPSI